MRRVLRRGFSELCPRGCKPRAGGLAQVLTGRYLLRRRRGKGGMGTLYEALDTALDRRVAVKVLRDDLTSSPLAAERFRQEARVAASFTHPNVVTVYAVSWFIAI